MNCCIFLGQDFEGAVDQSQVWETRVYIHRETRALFSRWEQHVQTHGGFFVVHCDSSCNKLLFLWVCGTMRSVSFSHFSHIPRCLFAPDYAYLTLWDLSQRSILRLTGRISSFMAYSLIYWEARSHWLTVISSLKHTSTHARTNMHASVFSVALHEFQCTAWDLLMCLDIHTEGLCVCNGVFEVGVQ